MTKTRAMSRRKQEKPQPRKNLVIGEELTQDYLTCGVCQRDFPLCDIVRFIQHKVHSCSNKENTSNCLSKLFGYSPDDSESEDGTNQTSKEVCKKDAEVPEHKVVSSTINAPLKDNKATSPKEPDKFEPCHYLCSTCKQPHPSALSLLQHAQNHHGLKIYVESSHVVNSNISAAKLSTEQNAPPQPAIRAPLLERQLDPTPLFPRSTSQELRLDLLGLSSTNSQLPSVDSSPPPLLEVHALDMPLNAPSLAVTNEPLDFYSKRLRELAGATSPSALLSSQMKLLQPNFKAVVNNKPNIHPSNTNERSHQGTNCINNPSQLPQSSASSTTSENPPASPKTNSKSCEFCGKCFRFMSNLIVHRRSHTGEKPFKCHVCNHACTQASKLKRHMKTHKRKRKNSSSDRPLALSESVAKNGIQSSDEASTIKNHEAQTNGESEYLSDDPNGVHHAEDEIEDDEDEEIDVEEDEVDEDDDDDDQTQPKLVVDHEQDEEDMVAQDLSKKPMKNGSSESNGISKEERKGKGHKAIKHSLLSEVMENIGLASIQQYSEAYKQALKESSALKHDRHSDGSASNDGANHLERPSREGTRSAGQSPLGLNTGLLSAFDQTMGVKRIKLEDHWRDKDENSLYAGLWIPSSHSMSSYKDLYSSDGSDRRKSKNESALVCTSPSSVRSSSPRPGPSNSLCNLGSITNSLLKPKDQRRNDTCEYCGKVFKNCSNLTVHRRSHTGEKPYKCELCSYACAQSSKLTRHMKTHGRMGKDVYRCRFCDMPFSVPSTLEKHMRKCVVSQSTSSYRLAERESDSKEMIAYCPRDSDC